MLAQADGGVVQFCILGISGLLLALERQWRTGREKFPSLQVAVVVFSGLSECVVPLSLLRLFTFTWVSSAAGKTLVVVEIVTTTQTQAPSLGLSHIPVKRATEQWG